MASIMYFFAIAVCAVDGLSGLILNLILLRSQWKTAKAENLYRIPIYVSVIQGGLLCIVLVVFCPCHIFRDGTFTIAFFNPVSPFIPRVLCDIILVIAVCLATMMWTLIPAIGVLQLFALSRFQWSNPRRLACAFAFTTASEILIAVLSISFVPTAEFHADLVKDARELYKLDDSLQLVLYGSSITKVANNDGRSLLPILIGVVMIPYACSYALFLTLVLLIRRQLVRFGAAQSARTIRTQRALVLMQVLQGFLPLAILSVPIGIFVVGAVLQIDMDFVTLVFTVFIWACPSVQALVQLRFIRQSTAKSPEATRTTEISRITSNVRRSER